RKRASRKSEVGSQTTCRTAGPRGSGGIRPRRRPRREIITVGPKVRGGPGASAPAGARAGRSSLPDRRSEGSGGIRPRRRPRRKIITVGPQVRGVRGHPPPPAPAPGDHHCRTAGPRGYGGIRPRRRPRREIITVGPKVRGGPGASAPAGACAGKSKEPDDVAVVVYVDLHEGGGGAEAGHGAHLAQDGIDEPGSHRGPHLPDRDRVSGRSTLESGVVGDREVGLGHADG